MAIVPYDDWSESFKTGAISAAGNYLGGLLGKGISQGLGTENAYTKELINNYTTFGMRKLLGGDEKFDMGSISQVDTMNLVVQDMYQSYKAKDKTSKAESDPHEKSSEDSSDKFKDPFAALDQALSGIFVSLGKGLGQTMKDVADVIKNGAVATWQGVSNFGEKAGNWFMGDGFNTDEGVAYNKIVQNIAKSTQVMYGDDGTMYVRNKNGQMEDSMTQEDYRELQLAMQIENRDNFHNGEGDYKLELTGGSVLEKGMKDMLMPPTNLKSLIEGQIIGAIVSSIIDSKQDKDSLYFDDNMRKMKQKFMDNDWAFDSNNVAEKEINGQMYRVLLGCGTIDKFIDSPVGVIAKQLVPPGVMDGIKLATGVAAIQKLYPETYSNANDIIDTYTPRSGNIISIYTNKFDPAEWERKTISEGSDLNSYFTNKGSEMSYGKNWEILNIEITQSYEKRSYIGDSYRNDFYNEIKKENEKKRKKKEQENANFWKN